MQPHSWRDPHMVRTIRSLLKALYITAGVFLFLAVLAHLVGVLYVSWLGQRVDTAFQSGIAADLAHLGNEADALAHSEPVVTYVQAGDTPHLLSFIQQEAAPAP